MVGTLHNLVDPKVTLMDPLKRSSSNNCGFVAQLVRTLHNLVEPKVTYMDPLQWSSSYNCSFIAQLVKTLNNPVHPKLTLMDPLQWSSSYNCGFIAHLLRTLNNFVHPKVTLMNPTHNNCGFIAQLVRTLSTYQEQLIQTFWRFSRLSFKTILWFSFQRPTRRQLIDLKGNSMYHRWVDLLMFAWSFNTDVKTETFESMMNWFSYLTLNTV